MPVPAREVLVGLVALAGAAHGAALGEEEGADGRGSVRPEARPQPAGLVVQLVLAAVAVLGTYAAVYPVDFTLRSPAYRRFNSAGLRFNALAVLDALPYTSKQMVSPAALKWLRERALIFCPRLVIKLASFGLVRGAHGGPPQAFVGSLVAAVFVTMYAYPFKLVESQQVLLKGDNARYYDKAWFIAQKLRLQGPLSLYEGVLEALPHVAIWNLLLLNTMDLTCRVLGERALLSMLVAAPLAVVAAATFTPPGDRLVRILRDSPLDIDALLYGFNQPKGPGRTLQPNAFVLRNHLEFVWNVFREDGLLATLGGIELQANTVALALSLFVHHQLLRVAG